jgi:hypothetical protein
VIDTEVVVGTSPAPIEGIWPGTVVGGTRAAGAVVERVIVEDGRPLPPTFEAKTCRS